jgi:glycosyltransferase involved in cell wall biosynthesis
MTVVIVGGSLPYPANAGNRIRTLNLVVRLAPRHRIIFLCHKNPNQQEEAEAIAYLKERGIEAITVEHVVPNKSGPVFYAKLASNVFADLPYSISSHVSEPVRRAVDELAAREKVDLWQAEALPYFEAFRHVPHARTLIMAHNVETLIWERYQATERNPLKRWYIGEQVRKFARYEAKAFREATRVVTVSDEDAAIARERFKATRIDVVDNGVDRSYFESVTPARDPNQILFLGSLEWRPNLDAVGLLLDKIFPEVVAVRPDVRLTIVGRNPPPALIRRVAGLDNVELHSNVADVRPYLAGSAVMAVPLRIGGGSRLKILEALATGLPVVSTKVGAEGLHLTPGVDLSIVDGEAGFANSLLETLNDPARAQAVAATGRQKVLDRYDWDVLALKFEEAWERCRQG